MLENIFNGQLWLKSLIGLGIIFIIFLESLILSRRKTTPVILLDMLFFGLISIILFGWRCAIYLTVFLILILFKKYRDKWYSDKSSLDYAEDIFSISKLFNSLNVKLKKDKSIIIGTVKPTNFLDLPNNGKAVRFNEQVLSGACLVSGSIGSGKTSTLKSVLTQGLVLNKPVAFFDYKGELEILDYLENKANSLGIDYYEFSDRGCNFIYDPFVNLNETGKIEALLNTRRWSADGADEHYKTNMVSALQNIIPAYEEYRRNNPTNDCYIRGLYNFTLTYTPKNMNDKDGINSLSKQLNIILTSRGRELFEGENKKVFSFEDDKPYIICFSFTSSNKSLANSLSSFIYQDMMDRGTRRKYPKGILLGIDEFGTLENSTVIKDILEKGRSGGIQTVFSILDINQIAMTSGDHFVNAILGTINTLVLHAGATTKTAEIMGGVSKYDIENDIMSLEKPQNGKPPTALMVSKFKILNKRGSQEIHRIIPYTTKEMIEVGKVVNRVIEEKQEENKPFIEEEQEEVIVEPAYNSVEEEQQPNDIFNINNFLNKEE